MERSRLATHSTDTAAAGAQTRTRSVFSARMGHLVVRAEVISARGYALPEPAALYPWLAESAVVVPVSLAPPLAVPAVSVPPSFGAGTGAPAWEEPPFCPAWLLPSLAAAEISAPLSTPVAVVVRAMSEIPLPLVDDELPRVSGWAPAWLFAPGTEMPTCASMSWATSCAAPGRVPAAASPVIATNAPERTRTG